MGDASEKQAKPSFWKGVKSEFKKIIGLTESPP